jgi:hypothetical protein
MVNAGAGSPQPPWACRDWLAAAGLFAATAAVILWQNAHLAVLFDIGYVLDSAARIAACQLPYRDFPFVHAPLTFLIQAAIIRLTGRVFFHHVLYVAMVGALSTVLAWRIALQTLQSRVASAWAVALLLALPLTVLGLYCIFPHPSYDCDCIFSILLALYLLQRLTPDERATLAPGRPASMLRGLLTGAALCLPLFFKQNIGLPFLAAVVATLLLLVTMDLMRRSRTVQPHPETAILSAVLGGAAATLLLAVLLIHFAVGLGNYLHWTFQFAAQRRLPGLRDMLGVYADPTLLWTLPSVAAGLLLWLSPLAKERWARIAVLAFLSAPFLFTLGSLFLYDDADERGDSLLALWPLLLILAAALALWNLFGLRCNLGLRPLLPILLLAAIHGTMMSQQLWGSTYALWPLLIPLIAGMIAFLASLKSPAAATGVLSRNLASAMAIVISATLLICGGFYTASEERLSYVHLPDEPPQHSAFPELRGMAASGPYLPDFEELLRYAQANIPPSDGLILVPGEDPFYFATGRVPQFPVLLFDRTTNPYSPDQLLEEARLHQVRWLIVKRNLQINADSTPQLEATLKALTTDFTLVAHLHAYDIYRRTPVNTR